ncbi:MAG TPA: hypothetical protein VMU09_00275 [Acidimicrobiales bacterium]|nr:hypothetical protein [Acidimicrobiales bacterium]
MAEPTAREFFRAVRRGRLPTVRSLARAVRIYLRPSFHPITEGRTEVALAYLARSPAAAGYGKPVEQVVAGPGGA